MARPRAIRTRHPDPQPQPLVRSAVRDYEAAQQLLQGRPASDAAAHQAALHQAIAHLREALRAEPDYAAALLLLGKAQVEAGNARTAVQSFVRLSELEPDRARAHEYLGELFASHQLYDRAELEFRLALRRRPDSRQAAFGLALAQARNRQWSDAVSSLNKLLQLAPRDVKAHRLLGTVEASQDQLPAARQQFQQVIELRPRDPQGYLDLGELYAKAGDYNAAKQSLRKALALSPAPAAIARLDLARAAHALGRDNDALETLAPLLRTPAVPEALVLDGLSQEQLQHAAVAARDYEKLMRLAPMDFRGYQLLGASELDQHQVRQALPVLRQAVQLSAGNGEADFLYGKALFETGNMAEAEKECKTAVALLAQDARPHYLLFQIYSRTHHPVRARAELKLAQQINAAQRQKQMGMAAPRVQMEP